MPEPSKTIGANSRSPFAGCAILIAAMAVMVFLVVFSTWGLFRQYGEIVKFTAAKPEPVAISPVDDNAAEVNALAVKLEKFRQDLAGDVPATLALTPEEINLAIAAYEPFKELRGTFHVLGVDATTLRVAISYQLNGKPRLARTGESGWLVSDPRYLNATLQVEPKLLGKEVVLQINTIEVPGVTVPTEFREQMSPHRITERYLTHAVIGPAMAKLTAVSVADGKVLFQRTPGQVPTDRISDAEVDSASSRLFTGLGIVACVFLSLVGLVIFVGLRAKAKRG